MWREGSERYVGGTKNHTKNSKKGCRGTAMLKKIEAIDPEVVDSYRGLATCIGKARAKRWTSLEGSDPELVKGGAGESATSSAMYLDGKGSYYDDYEEDEIEDYETEYDSDTTFDEFEGELGVVSVETIEVKGSCELCSGHKSTKMMNAGCLECDLLKTENHQDDEWC